MAHIIDLSAPEVHADPYPYYAELRKSNPVCQVDPGGIWVLTRYDDVQHMFRHPEIFSSSGFRAIWAPPWLKENPLAESALPMDPPEHTKNRNLINRAFGPSLATKMEPRVREIARSLASGITPGAETDFVSAFGFALPAIAIATMLGMDIERHKDFGHWIHTLTEISPATPPSMQEGMKATLTEMNSYFQGFIESRRQKPLDDLTTGLINAEIDGVHLSDREIVAFLFLLVAAAIETTGHLLANAVRFLTTAPEITAALRADRSKIPQFIEEMLRWDGPGQGAPRIVMSTTEVGGVTIPQYSMVLGLVSSANRDERRFPNGEQFDLTRDVQGSLMFGHGVHYCVGAAIAKLEARVAFEVLLEHFRGFEATPGKIEWNSSLVTRGPLKMPIRFLPA